MVLVDATSALGVLWTLWMYERCPLVMVAPSVKTFLCFTNLQFSQLIGACASVDELLGVPCTNHRKDGQLHDGIGLHEVRDAPNSPTHGDMASPTELCEGG